MCYKMEFSVLKRKSVWPTMWSPADFGSHVAVSLRFTAT